jgi:hypothetical protein
MFATLPAQPVAGHGGVLSSQPWMGIRADPISKKKKKKKTYQNNQLGDT